ncbi:MAG TPA: proline dehydrogenase family protein [Anaerolineales bacterium]|nr:proline dehydrogenase family protein [Anaerolineales bacterium]
MLRGLFIRLSKAGWARRIVTKWPLAWKVSSRFIAGEKLEDAVRTIKTLNQKGLVVTLDHLGEHTHSEKEAKVAVAHIIESIDAITRERLRAGVSIKLTQIGLGVDDMMCAENLAYILSYAKASDVFIRIDMEDSPYVDETLLLFHYFREQGFDNVGIVIQAYLYRSLEDTRKLMETGSRVRLVKGAYKEPPILAFPKKKDADTNFDRLTDVLIEGSLRAGCPPLSVSGRIPPIPAIASHDENRINYAKAAAAQAGLPKPALEFQMLHGIRRDLQEKLRDEGYPVRIYVPYGSEWYPYFMRRLAERPANIWFFVSNLFRK